MEINPHLGLPIDEFIEKNIKLGHKVAQRYHKFVASGTFEYNELFNLALMGMTKAYQKFDPTLFENVKKFSTYAVPMMIGEIQRFLRDHNPGPKFSRGAKEVASIIRKNEWYDEPHEWILEQIKKSHPHMSKIKMQQVKLAFAYFVHSSPQSIHETVYENDGDPITLGDQLGIGEDFTQVFVDEFLETLDEKERLVMELRLKDATQKQIGEVAGVSQVQISRIIQKVGEKLLEYKNRERVETPAVGEHIREKIIIMEENEMARKRAQGDRTKAKELLANTLMTYKEIADETRVPLGTVSIMAPQYRDELVRKAMGAKDPIKKAEYLREAGYEKEATAILNELGMVDYKNDVDEVVVEKPKAVELPKVMVLDEPIGKTKTIPEAIEEFKADIRKELYNEIREQVLEEMAAESKAEEASYGTIQKFFTFKYKASGGRVSTQDFINEMQELLSTLDASGNEFVTFALSIDAE